jgi:hypothetical protein
MQLEWYNTHEHKAQSYWLLTYIYFHHSTLNGQIKETPIVIPYFSYAVVILTGKG